MMVAWEYFEVWSWERMRSSTATTRSGDGGLGAGLAARGARGCAWEDGTGNEASSKLAARIKPRRLAMVGLDAPRAQKFHRVLYGRRPVALDGKKGRDR